MNFRVVVLLLVIFGVAGCGGSPETENALPGHQLSPPDQSGDENTPPVDSAEETIPDTDEGQNPGQEPETPPEPPVFLDDPDDSSIDDLDDYVAEDDDRIQDDDLDPVEEIDPEFDHCSLLEQVTGR